MLGFDVGERTISRWVRRCPKKPDPSQRWLAFLRNQPKVIAAIDFFPVPTITFHVLYGFFVIAHDRRSILHFNVTAHPTSIWVPQQLREAFPNVANTDYLIFDHDAKYGFEVSAAIRGMGIAPLHTALRSPWQNGVAERLWEAADLSCWITLFRQTRVIGGDLSRTMFLTTMTIELTWH
jgi:putative transposase